MTQPIKAILIMEILGKPAEHIKKVLEEIVEKLGKEKDVEITSKTIAEPKQIEGQEDVYSSFAEVELKTNLHTLMMLIFGYMPSNIEIIGPENLSISNTDINTFFNELARRLHQYDELTKAMLYERRIIAQHIKEGRIKIQGAEKETKKDKEKKKSDS